MRGLKSETGSSLLIPGAASGAGGQAGGANDSLFQPMPGDSTDMLNSRQPSVPQTSQQLSDREEMQKLREQVGTLQSARSELERKLEVMKEALAQAEAKLEETIPSVQSTQAIPYVTVLGSKTGTENPNTEQQKATAKLYLDSQQVHKTLQGLVADLVLTQPPNAIRHMYSVLGAMIGEAHAHTVSDDAGKENAEPNSASTAPVSAGGKERPGEEAWRMRVFVECTGPGGRGERCSMTRIAKMGKRVLAGEVMVPPVGDWAREAVAEMERVLCGSWGVECGLSPPATLRIAIAQE